MEFSAEDEMGQWINDIPLIGDEHLMVESRTKVLNGKQFTNPNGRLLVDTGT